MSNVAMDERVGAAFQLVGVLSWIYDSHKQAIPESYQPEVKRLLKIAMPKWNPLEEE